VEQSGCTRVAGVRKLSLACLAWRALHTCGKGIGTYPCLQRVPVRRVGSGLRSRAVQRICIKSVATAKSLCNNSLDWSIALLFAAVNLAGPYTLPLL
jgi:hypothetical protein